MNYRAYALKLVYFQFIPIHMQYFISQSFSYSSNILPPKSFLHSDVTLDVLWAVSSRYPKDNRPSTCCKPTDTAHASQRSRCWDSPCLMNSPDLVDHIFVRLSYTKFSYFNNSPKDLCFLFFTNKSIVSVEFNSQIRRDKNFICLRLILSYVIFLLVKLLLQSE